MRLVAAIVSYGNPSGLRSTLKSLKEFVDWGIVRYGPFRGHPLLPEPQESDDAAESRAITLDAGYVFRRHRSAVSQAEARSQVFTVPGLRDGDWLLIVDDDETFSAGPSFLPQLAPLDASYATVGVLDPRDGVDRAAPQNRLIRWVPGLTYGGNHWTILRNNEEFCRNASPPFHPIDARLLNHPENRGFDAQRRRALYRLLRFLAPDWRLSPHETGRLGGPYSEAEVERTLQAAKAAHRKTGSTFDRSFLMTLAWLRKGCDQDIPIGDTEKGFTLAILFAAGVTESPY